MTNAARERFEALYHRRNLPHETREDAKLMMRTSWSGNGYDDKHMDDCYFYFLAIEAVDPDVQINVRRQYEAGGE